MAAIQLADTSKITGKTRELLDGFEKNMGLMPNIFKLMANSPAALEGFMLFRDSLSRGSLDEQMRARIGITIAETYSCEYMLAARVAMAKKAGISDEELQMAREQRSKDPKVNAGLGFVRTLVLRHGEMAESDLGDLKAAGYSDGEVAELIANVALNMYAYYFIQVAKPEADFPSVPVAFPA